MHDHRTMEREIRSEMRELLHVVALWRPIRELEERHVRLRSRLVFFFLVSFIVDTAMTLLVLLVERGQGNGCVGNCVDGLGPALAWSTSELLVGGSSYAVQSGVGHILEVLAHLYGVSVIAALAGAFASFFTSRAITSSDQSGAIS